MPLIKQRHELHTAESDRLQLICGYQAVILAGQFGEQPIRPIPEKWVYVRGEWRISYAWLMVRDGKQGNYGFRVILRGSITGPRCELNVWAPGDRLEFERPGMIDAEQLARALSLAFTGI